MPPITQEGQAAKDRIRQARQRVNAGATPVQARTLSRQAPTGPTTPRIAPVQPTVTASALTTPPAPVTVPQPLQPSIPSNTLNIARNVSRDVNGFISAQTEEAKQLKDLQATYGALSDQGSLTDLFKSTQAEYGVTGDSFKELKDIQLQLGDMDTASAMTKTKIEGGAGQTLGQAQREVTQEDRENAVRTAGLASRAAVLQGNIETATALAKDTVNMAYQDRTLQATNLLNQINMVQEQVSDQDAQLLEQEKRGYEAELAAIAEVKEAVSTAMVANASQSEISILTDSTTPDAEKIALSQQIIARNASEDISLDRQAKRASIASSQASTANSYDAIRSRQVALREAAQEASTEQDKIALETTAKTEQALELKKLTTELLGDPGFGAAVGKGFKKSIVGSIPFVSGAAGAGTDRADFEAKAERVANLLTLDNLDLMSGVLSETDIKILETSGSNLRNFNMSEDAYRKEVERVMSVMDRTISKNGITPEQAQFWGVMDDNDIQTFNSLWDTL